MLTRGITGIIFVTVLVGAIVWHPYALAGLFFVISMIGLHEFYGLAEKAGAKPQKFLGLIMGAVTYCAVIRSLLHKDGMIGKYLVLLLPLFVIIMVAELYRKKENPFTNLAYTFFGILYIVVPFLLLNFMVSHDGESSYFYQGVLGFFIMIWANDTGAYLSGRSFGKHKLFERVSPNKTWEGTIGGVVLTIGFAVLWSWIWDAPEPFSNLINWIVIAVIVAVLGGLGDLVESLFKRSIDVKDSGKIMPGHGGILDRFDGVFLAAPVVFTYIYLTS